MKPALRQHTGHEEEPWRIGHGSLPWGWRFLLWAGRDADPSWHHRTNNTNMQTGSDNGCTSHPKFTPKLSLQKTTALGLKGKKKRGNLFPQHKQCILLPQEKFNSCPGSIYTLCLPWFCLWVVFFFFVVVFPLLLKEEKKKNLSKKPSRTKTTNIHYWEPSNPGTKNTTERLREEADQKNLHASQDPPQSQLEPLLLHHWHGQPPH